MKFTCILSNGSNRVCLDTSTLKMEGKEHLEPYLKFNCQTFKNIKDYAVSPIGFDYIFKAPNLALEQLDNDKQIIVAKYFASACCVIREHMPKDPIEFVKATEELGKQYCDMCDQIGAYELFKNYAYNNITLQDTSEFGTRPQDTAELTFREDEMRETMILAIFCKFATPIFGELINNLPPCDVVSNGKNRPSRQKESRCAWFLTAVHAKYFPALLNKLEFYITHIVKGMCDKNQDPAAIFAGHTISTRVANIMSSLWVRNYVLCNLEKPESNIIRYTDTMVRTLVQTQDTNAHKAQVRPRKVPGSMMAGDDTGNMSQIEIDSIVSTGMMDCPIIIESAIDDVVDDHRLQYEISNEEFNKCLEYFREHPIYQTPLNKFVATDVFSKDIGGGRGIEIIDAFAYTKLIAILQLIAFNLGFFELGVALTATKTNNIRVLTSGDIDLFRRQAPTLPYYRECRSKFATGSHDDLYLDYTKNIREREWDQQMDELINDLATVKYTVNVPDVILDIVPDGKTEPISSFIHNGDEMLPTTEITEQACNLVSIYNKGF